MSDEPKLRALPQVRREMMIERFAGIAMGELITSQKIPQGRRVTCDVKACYDIAEAMVAEAERRAALKQ